MPDRWALDAKIDNKLRDRNPFVNVGNETYCEETATGRAACGAVDLLPEIP